MWWIMEELKGFHGERSINKGGGNYRKLMVSEGGGGVTRIL